MIDTARLTPDARYLVSFDRERTARVIELASVVASLGKGA
jgi:hypothetical protein